MDISYGLVAGDRRHFRTLVAPQKNYGSGLTYYPPKFEQLGGGKLYSNLNEAMRAYREYHWSRKRFMANSRGLTDPDKEYLFPEINVEQIVIETTVIDLNVDEEFFKFFMQIEDSEIAALALELQQKRVDYKYIVLADPTNIKSNNLNIVKHRRHNRMKATMYAVQGLDDLTYIRMKSVNVYGIWDKNPGLAL